MSWKDATLGQLLSLQRGYDLPSDNRIYGEIPIIGSAGITGFHNEAKVFGGGVTVGRSGNSFGKVFRCKEDFWPHNASLYVKENFGNDIDYIYYFLKNIDFTNYNSGSAQPSLNRNFIYPIKIEIPSLETQKRIASILSTYDDLIENNLKRIKLLEETAQNIYKEWFVNFRFPNYEHTEFDAESGLPVGWEMKKISSIVEFKGGFPFKSSEYTESGKYRIVTIKNVGDRFFDGNNTSGIENIPDKMKEYCKLQEGNILMSLTGNIGRTCLVYGENYLLNQRVVIVTPINSENSAFCYFLFNTDSIKGLMNNLSSGVAQQNLSPVKLEEQLIPLPPMSLMLKYSSAINGIVNQIISLNKQNGKLKEARDILLPRLMNRTIEV